MLLYRGVVMNTFDLPDVPPLREVAFEYYLELQRRGVTSIHFGPIDGPYKSNSLNRKLVAAKEWMEYHGLPM